MTTHPLLCGPRRKRSGPRPRPGGSARDGGPSAEAPRGPSTPLGTGLPMPRGRGDPEPTRTRPHPGPYRGAGRVAEHGNARRGPFRPPRFGAPGGRAAVPRSPDRRCATSSGRWRTRADPGCGTTPGPRPPPRWRRGLGPGTGRRRALRGAPRRGPPHPPDLLPLEACGCGREAYGRDGKASRAESSRVSREQGQATTPRGPSSPEGASVRDRAGRRGVRSRWSWSVRGRTSGCDRRARSGTREAQESNGRTVAGNGGVAVRSSPTEEGPEAGCIPRGTRNGEGARERGDARPGCRSGSRLWRAGTEGTHGTARARDGSGAATR